MFLGSKRSEMGIGTLILFVAMILVAAISAGVLIQTATNLQSKALETGTRSTTQVSTSMTTVLLYGEDGRDDGSLSDLYHNIKITPGSDSVKVDDMMITLDLSNSSVDFIYDSNATCAGGVTSGKFAAKYLKNGSEHLKGYITVGDVIQLCYALPRPVHEDEVLRLSVVPKLGSVMTIRAISPPAITTRRVFLYP